MKQRDAVFSAVVEALGSEPTSAVTLTKDQRKDVIDAVTAGISSGNVEFSADAKTKYDTDAKIRVYVSGLVNNWLRKDTRLNGNTQYKPANPGSRTSVADDQLKAMRALRKQLVAANDITKIAEVDAAIAARVAELKPAKVPTKKAVKEIDMTEVPAELKELLGIAS